MKYFFKKDEFSSVNKSKNKINLIIIGVGIIAIIVTGFFYVKRLENIDSPSMDIISTFEEGINS